MIDPKTVILLCGLMGGLMSLVLHSLCRNYPRSIEGLRQWAHGMLLWFLSGVAMVALQGRTPELLSIVLPNLLVLVGASMFWLGTGRFLGRPAGAEQVRIMAGVILAAILAVAWFTVVYPSYRARIAIMATMLLVLFGGHSGLVFRHGGRRFSARVVGVVLAMLALNHLVRLYTAVAMPAGTGLFDSLPQNVAYIMLLPALVLMLAIGMVLMASDRLRSELESLASRDPLTQALTRRSLADAFERIASTGRRDGRPLALLYLDLDHFKSVNDRLGHQVGDQVLMRFVKSAQGALRGADLLGRFGGEEFVAVLPDTTIEDARQVAERLRLGWAQHPEEPRSTVSIGVAGIGPEGAGTLEDLLRQADAALYRAKAAGRNQVSV